MKLHLAIAEATFYFEKLRVYILSAPNKGYSVSSLCCAVESAARL